MEDLKTELILELYPEYVEVIGTKKISEIVNNPDQFDLDKEDDSGLPFELNVVFESIGLAIKLIGAAINILSFKSNDNQNLENIKLKIIDSLIPKMSEEQLKKALGANTLEEIISAIIGKTE